MDAIVSKLCPEVASRYGAPMGRRSYGTTLISAPGPFWLRKIKLTDGYDPGGAYWGVPPVPGEDLYGYLSTNGTISGFVWARTRTEAWLLLKAKHPNAKRA